jgi:hypothetical protein
VPWKDDAALSPGPCRTARCDSISTAVSAANLGWCFHFPRAHLAALAGDADGEGDKAIGGGYLKKPLLAEVAVVAESFPGAAHKLLNSLKAVIDVEDNEGSVEGIVHLPLRSGLPQKLRNIGLCLVPAHGWG